MGDVKFDNCLEIEFTAEEVEKTKKADVIRIGEREFISREKTVEMLSAFYVEQVNEEISNLKAEIQALTTQSIVITPERKDAILKDCFKNMYNGMDFQFWETFKKSSKQYAHLSIAFDVIKDAFFAKQDAPKAPVSDVK